jgi:hypothetical protein
METDTDMALAMDGEITIRVTKHFIEAITTRDALGNRLSLELGEPDTDGVYCPIVTVHYDDNLVDDYRRVLLMVREELCFGGNWEDARANIDRLLNAGILPLGGPVW